jgi:hypothetical protein
MRSVQPIRGPKAALIHQFESGVMHRSRQVFFEIGFKLRQVLFATFDGAVLLDHLVAKFLVGVKLTQSNQGTTAC